MYIQGFPTIYILTWPEMLVKDQNETYCMHACTSKFRARNSRGYMQLVMFQVKAEVSHAAWLFY